MKIANFKTILTCILFFGLLLAKSTMEAQQIQQRHQKVLELNPVGYWPMDDGVGDVLHDLSNSKNHGVLFGVPWKDGLLDFNGGYHWAEIPNHPTYQSKAFSISIWVFTRKRIIGGGYPGNKGMTLIGNAYGGSGFTLEKLYDEPDLFEKSQLFGGGVPFDHRTSGISICLRRDELVDVISGGKDVLGTHAGKIGIAIGEWQHVLYTFDSSVPIEGDREWSGLLEEKSYRGKTGSGKLYINGELIQSNDVSFSPRDQRFLLGSDAVWWLQADQSGSLNGSVRDLVFFDHALNEEKVKQLFVETRPISQPSIPETGTAQDNDKTVATTDLQKHIRKLKDNSILDREKAESALALAEIGNLAEDAIPALTGLLEDIIDKEGIRLPRIEDLLRNAVIRALLDISPKNDKARNALGLALAKPVFDALDLTQAKFDEIRPLVKSARYMDALEIYRNLKLDKVDRRFFSEGDLFRDIRPLGSGNDRAYTATAEHHGYKFKIGEGVAWRGVEKISVNEFESVVENLAAKYPEVTGWRLSDDPNLYRIPITKIDPEGVERTVYLEGEQFIIGTDDAKYRGWSIAVDTEGYIHVTGGMHNAPHQYNYIPGSWEKMGLSRKFTDDNYPAIMYWVSKKPMDIGSFEFRGQRNNPRRVPVPHGINYMNFTQDRNGKLYLYGRIYVQGIQSWGLYRYDTKLQRWSGVGGFAPDVKKEFPEWADYHIEMAVDWLALPTMRWKHDHPNNTVLAWARQPHFYNYIRGWGIKFDPDNRMHVLVSLFGLDEQNQNANRKLYAWSDDNGNTFHRADGTQVELPLTVNPGAGNVDMANHSTNHWWNLWISLLHDAGYAVTKQ